MVELRTYDASIDEFRPLTQLDLDLLDACRVAYGEVVTAKEQCLDFESLVDRLEEIHLEFRARVERLKTGEGWK